MSNDIMKDILSEMVSGQAGVWLVMVADRDGLVISSWESPDNRIPPESFSVFIQIINTSINAFKASDVGFTKLDDITYATPFTYMVAKPIAEGECFLFVSAHKSVPLGLILMQCAKFAPKLESALPGRESLPNRNGMRTIVT